MHRVDLIPETILACCVLHNLCIDDVDEDIDDYILNDEPIHDEVDDNNEELHAGGELHEEGFNKRNYIAQLLHLVD